jgi:hypothetical protein
MLVDPHPTCLPETIESLESFEFKVYGFHAYQVT